MNRVAFSVKISGSSQYKPAVNRQLAFDDFNQSCGMQLDPRNEWCILAGRIDWSAAEARYAACFKSGKGHPAVPLRQAMGALVIQKRMGLSDRALVKAIAENPYYQYFIGLASFPVKRPFTCSTLPLFRRRISAEMLMAANESFLKDSPSTPEHRDAQPKGKATPPPEAGADGVAGTLIPDAACSPVDIRFPQDFSLLNEAREKTDEIIDALHRQVAEKGERHPRTYREVLRKACLGMAKARKRPADKMRALVRRLLLALARNLGFIDALLARGGASPAARPGCWTPLENCTASKRRCSMRAAIARQTG